MTKIQNLNEKLDEKISSLGKMQSFKNKEFLFHAEDDAESMFYIQKGEVRVFKIDEHGREMEVVRLYSGDFFGEAIIFTTAAYPAYAQAVKDSQVLRFSKIDISEAIDKESSIANFFIHLMASKCMTLTKRIESLGLMTIRQRLIHFLLSKCSGEQACLIELDIKKSELAKILGTISETLSRNLRDMQKDGLIEVEAGKIHIKDCCRLRSEISG